MAKKNEAYAVWRREQAAKKKARTASIPKWAHIRRLILERDEHVCRICGVDPCEEQLHVHHVDWDRRNNTLRNLVTLCISCHKAIHLHGYRPDGTDVEPWGDRQHD